VLIVAGDVRRADLRRLAEEHLGPWKAETTPEPAEVPTPRTGTEPRLRVVVADRPDAEQTTIQWVLPGVPWGHDDHLALRVLTEIFGGSFTSRLNARLREAEGLTYGAYASLGAYAGDGVLEASAAVDVEKTRAALVAFIEELDRLASADVTAEETARAAATLQSSTIQSLADLSGTVSAFVPYAQHGAAPDALRREHHAMADFTVETANDVARRHIADRAGTTVLVLVGDKGKVLAALQGLDLPVPLVLTPEKALDPQPFPWENAAKRPATEKR
jgi:zinc protease